MRAAIAITQREAAAGGRPGSERLAIRCTPLFAILQPIALPSYVSAVCGVVLMSSCRLHVIVAPSRRLLHYVFTSNIVVENCGVTSMLLLGLLVICPLGVVGLEAATD